MIKFKENELNRMRKLINIHFSLPIAYDLSGGSFEAFFADALGGKRETKKLLFDVTLGSTGWSLKTLQTNSDEKFEIVLKRCDVINDKLAWQTEDAQKIGDAVIDNFIDFYTKSKEQQGISDPRISILLVHKKYPRFRVFQSELNMPNPKDIVWEFSKFDKNGKEKKEIRSIIGKIAGETRYRWYRSGTQLFGVYSLTKEINESQFDAIPHQIEMALLEKAYDEAPAKSAQSIQQQAELLSSQLDDTESDTNQ